MVNKKFLFETNFTTKEEVFKEATNFLVQEGYVSQEFELALNTREAEFPTGLPTSPPVAIPHTDGTYVKKDTILCILNNNEIIFNEMGGDEEDVVSPKVIFMLVLRGGEIHLQQLQNLIEKIQGGDLVNEILKAKTVEEFKLAVDKYL